jgi:integrase
LPPYLLVELDHALGLSALQPDARSARQRIWRWSRTTAWRRIKKVMSLASILGAAAMPKGLRHTFGVNAFEVDIPAHIIQRWLGHASLRTTAIYGDVVGAEERKIAARMWQARKRVTPPISVAVQSRINQSVG